MHVKHGELLPRVDPEGGSRSIGYYVAENATLTIYQPLPVSLSLLTLMCFLTGCLLGFVLFIWTSDVRSADRELAFLRSSSLPDREQNHYIVMPVLDPQESNKTQEPSLPKEKIDAIPVENRKPVTNSENYSIEISRKAPTALTSAISQAISLAATQDYKTAETTLLNQYRRGQVSPELLNALGVLYSKNGNWRKAVLSFERACDNYKDEGLCYYNLAVSYDHLKHRSKALGAYQKALMERPIGSERFDAETVENRIQELQAW